MIIIIMSSLISIYFHLFLFSNDLSELDAIKYICNGLNVVVEDRHGSKQEKIIVEGNASI